MELAPDLNSKPPRGGFGQLFCSANVNQPKCKVLAGAGYDRCGGNRTDDFVALPDRLIMQLQRSTGGLKQRKSSGNAVPLLIFTHLIPVLLAAVLWYLLSALNGRKGWFRIGEIIFWDVIILIIVLLIWLRLS